MDIQLLILVLLFVVTGAIIKGLAGFGFGILGTALLMNFVDPSIAITVMILPMLAVNIPLILEAEFPALKSCVKNFKFFLLTGLIGSVIGVLLVDFLPVNLLAVLVGFLAVFYVYIKQDLVYKPEAHVSKTFTEKWQSQTVIGLFSGTVFGASNIGLMFVSYLDRLEVDRKTFVGLLSLLIFLATVLRASLSLGTGLYTLELLVISLLASVVGVAVAEVSAKISHKLSEKYLKYLTLVLILVSGLRILWNNIVSF